MINFVIIAALLVAVFFAARGLVKSIKNGGCCGCSACKGGAGCHCGKNK